MLLERQALGLLDIMEKGDRGELMLDEKMREWWSSKFRRFLVKFGTI